MNKFEKRKQNLNKMSVYSVLFIIYFLITVDCTLSVDAKQITTAAADLPFCVPDIKEPKFPNKTFRITDYGAVGDGHTKNTQAFAKAINACADAGGGRVIVPAGLWLTGSIQLKSNLNLHLEQGAVVLFSPNFEDYPLVRRTWEGSAAVRCSPPLFGENLKNVAITGSGIFDGSGQAWRPVKKVKMTENQWRKLTNSGGVVDSSGSIWYPSQEAMNGPKTVAELDARGADINEYAAARQFLRPVLVGLVECKNVLLDGPTFQNSPGWNIHPLMCENVIIRNIVVLNPWYSQNGDGLDVESCRNVIITNCRFDVGDDAICMKSGRNEYGRRRNRPTENVAISDCVVYHGHGGFTVGSEMSGGVRNIYIRNCDFLGTDVGLRFKSTRGRGGVVENIFIQGIRMKDIPTDAIQFDMYYGSRVALAGDDTSEDKEVIPLVSEETPKFQNIHIRNIICSGAARGIWLRGLPEMPIQKINMENIVISANAGMTCIEADDIKLKNVRIIPAKFPTLELYNSRNFVIENVTLPDSNEVFIKLEGGRTAAIRLKGVDKPQIDKKIQFGKNVKPDAVIIE
ncbi:MAG: glycoside hydrolase family 28 protein [Phycisphaerae bacterium]|nr:glycoside hydrolase family 28 protein [Phycisphaerae bacterium]